MKKIKYGGAVCAEKELIAITKSVAKSIKTGNWQLGKEGAKFEKEAAKFLGVSHAVLTSSGSAAALLALLALELPKGSEVIIPAVTFPTVFNAILQAGLKPVVVDCEVGTYNINLDKLEGAIRRKTKAIICVHAVGNPCDMPRLMNIARRNKLRVIEDNCDGWGGSIGYDYHIGPYLAGANRKKVGSFGDISFTSFHAAHILSMGCGGAVFTNYKHLADKVCQYRDWGRQANTTAPHQCKDLPAHQDPRFVYDKIGYNFQILELQAAMGRVQLKKSNKVKRARTKNFNYLNEHLVKHRDLIMPRVVEGADPCWFSFPITTQGDRGKLTDYLESKGIETRSMFAGNITRHPAYRNSKYRIGNRLEQSDYILEHSFWISCHPKLTGKDLKFIIKTFDEYYAKS